MGRHTSEVAAGSGNGRRAAIILIGLLLLSLLAFFILPLFNGDDGDGEDASTPPASTTESAPSTNDAAPPTAAASGAASSTTSDAAPATEAPTTDAPTTDAPTAEAPTTEDAAPAGPPAELTACASEVAAGEELASVASVGAANWKAHFTASVDYNAGKIALDEANDIFNTTKVNVADEVAAYEVAQTAYDEASGGCTELGAADVDADLSAAAADCTAHASALSDLAATADKVNEDWASHGAMMASKADQDIEDYMAQWHHDVADAPATMDPHDDAVAALKDAPACTVD